MARHILLEFQLIQTKQIWEFKISKKAPVALKTAFSNKTFHYCPILSRISLQGRPLHIFILISSIKKIITHINLLTKTHSFINFILIFLFIMQKTFTYNRYHLTLFVESHLHSKFSNSETKKKQHSTYHLPDMIRFIVR